MQPDLTVGDRRFRFAWSGRDEATDTIYVPNMADTTTHART
jgi:hypothetical protein